MEPRSRQFQRQLGRIEELIHALNGDADPAIAAQTRELVQILLDLHGASLERALDIIHQSDPALIDKIAEDDLVSNLLVLHGLHPLDLETRVRIALESVKPRLGLHGGDIELLEVAPDGVVKLRLEGNCHGCPSSRLTLKFSIEEAIYAAAPEVTALEVEGAVDRSAIPPGFIPKFNDCPEPAIKQQIGVSV